MNRILWLALVAGTCLLAACATSHYVRPDEVTEWDYTYSDTDMKLLAEKMVMSLADLSLPQGKDGAKPTLAFLNIGNRTSQHIDTEGISEKILVALVKLAKFRIVDRDLLKQQAKEIALQETQRIDVDGAVRLGQLIGADYFLAGDVMSIEKTKGATTLAYYKLTMRLVNVRTSEIVWADEQELKKKSTKGWYE